MRLIDLYTYRGDLVLDPFMGVGSAAVAAVRTDRHFVGFDTDRAYAAAALERVGAERARLATLWPPEQTVAVPPAKADADPDNDGRRAGELARRALADAGFTDARRLQLSTGITQLLTATRP